MGEEAKIKVVLDTNTAHSQLDALYKKMGGSPGVGGGGAGSRMPGGGGGAGGAGGGGRGGMGFAGLGMGKMMGMGAGVLGAAAFGRTAIGDATRGIGLMTQPIANKVSEFLFGDLGQKGVGAQKALEQVQSAASLAVGYGADVSEFQSLFDAIKAREEKRETGRRKLAGGIDGEKGLEGVVGLDDIGGLLGGIKDVVVEIGKMIGSVIP